MKFSIKLGIGSSVTFILILLFGLVLFPIMLTSKIKKSLALKPGSDIRAMWTKVPFPVDFKVYMFNVTNANDVHNGDSPVLDEIGPYFFDEWKEKINLVDNEADDLITYNAKTRFVFNKEKSGKLTMDEIITLPHPMMTGMLMAVAREKPSMLGLVSKAMVEIFNDPKSIFVTASVRDILFNGLLVNCTVKGFGAKAVCTNIKSQASALDKLGENEYLFSFFGMKNKTIDPTLTVKRGIKNPRDVGVVVKWNDKPMMDKWPTETCNQYQGTDSTIFPAFLRKEEGLWSFSPDLCRSLEARYVEDTTYFGLPVRLYTADYGDMSSPEEKCFCPTNDTCLKKGVFDLHKCNGVPFHVSLPHFYNCDNSYLDGIRGLHPNKEDHNMVLLFESMTGTPVSAHKRMQFSLPIQTLLKVHFMSNLTTVLFPIMWVEEGVSLEESIIRQIDKQLFRTIRIVTGIKWTIATLSLVGVAVAIYLYNFKEKFPPIVTPVMGIVQGLANMNGNKNDETNRGSSISIVSIDKNINNDPKQQLT